MQDSEFLHLPIAFRHFQLPDRVCLGLGLFDQLGLAQSTVSEHLRIWTNGRSPHSITALGGMVGSSNFFELAVAVAISLFGLNFGAELTTMVGLLVKVPVMLVLVAYANKTRNKFPLAHIFN